MSDVRGDHGSPQSSACCFGLVLRAVRLATPNGHGRAISMAALARSVGADHSTISRLESGSRLPSRAMVLRLATALEVDDGVRDRLLASAGYAVVDLDLIASGDPTVALLASVLADTTIADGERDRIRQVVTLLCAGKGGDA